MWDGQPRLTSAYLGSQRPAPAASFAAGSTLQGKGLCQSFVVALEKGGWEEEEKIHSRLALIANWAKFRKEQLRQRRELLRL